VAISLDPQLGHEQKERRPALVVSKTEFHRHTGMAMLCPVSDLSCHVAGLKLGSLLAGFDSSTSFWAS